MGSDSLLPESGMELMHQKFLAFFIALALFVSLTGCGSSKHLPAALKAQSFQPAANSAAAPTVAPGKTGAADAADSSQPPIASAARPSTRPAVGSSSGTFMYIGTVVAEVNG